MPHAQLPNPGMASWILGYPVAMPEALQAPQEIIAQCGKARGAFIGMRVVLYIKSELFKSARDLRVPAVMAHGHTVGEKSGCQAESGSMSPRMVSGSEKKGGSFVQSFGSLRFPPGDRVAQVTGELPSRNRVMPPFPS